MMLPFFPVRKHSLKPRQIVVGLLTMSIVTQMLRTVVIFITMVPRTASGQTFQVTRVQDNSVVTTNKETYLVRGTEEDPWIDSILKLEYQSFLISSTTLYLTWIAVCWLKLLK